MAVHNPPVEEIFEEERPRTRPKRAGAPFASDVVELEMPTTRATRKRIPQTDVVVPSSSRYFPDETHENEGEGGDAIKWSADGPITRSTRPHRNLRVESTLQKKHRSPAFWIVATLLGAFVVWFLVWLTANWVVGIQDTSAYGTTRTFHLDAVVGHNDSAAHPTQLVAFNLRGHIEILELPGGDVSHARLYDGPDLVASNWPDAEHATALLSIKKEKNGKVALVVTIQSSSLNPLFQRTVSTVDLPGNGQSFDPNQH